MRLFQARDTGGATRLGIRRGGQALVLQSAHEGIGTTLDLFEAQEERGLEPRRWLEGAERVGHLAPFGWEDLAAGRGARLGLPVDPPEVWGARRWSAWRCTKACCCRRARRNAYAVPRKTNPSRPEVGGAGG